MSNKSDDISHFYDNISKAISITKNPVFWQPEIEIFLMIYHVDGLVQERCDSSALAMELCLSCTNPPIYGFTLCWWQLNLYNLWT